MCKIDYDSGLYAEVESNNVKLKKEIKLLQNKIIVLKQELAKAISNNDIRNKELDSLLYVWCDGGCESGVRRWHGSSGEVTEELVKLAEENTKRLRTWFENKKARELKNSK